MSAGASASPVVDIHVHLEPFPRGKVGQDEGRLERLLADMDEAGVDAACVFASRGRGSDYPAETRLITELAQRAPGRIVPFARVHPFEEEAVASLCDAARLGVRGLKLHPFMDGGFLPNDERLIHPLVAVAADAGLVVLIHSGGSYNTSPGLIIDLARSFPTVPIVIGHSGQFGPHREAAKVGKDVSNVYYDTAGLALPGAVREVVRVVGPERVLYGSDHFHTPFGFEIGKIRDWAGLSEAEVDLVLGGNAARLLGLDVGP